MIEGGLGPPGNERKLSTGKKSSGLPLGKSWAGKTHCHFWTASESNRDAGGADLKGSQMQKRGGKPIATRGSIDEGLPGP